MAEKGDLPSDQVSLPPTYAPSEAYTESPPPAYKRSGMAAVKVAKVVCLTMLIMTFLIGFTVVAHKWIQLKECDCSLQQETAQQALPLLAAFGDNNLNELKEDPVVKKSLMPLVEQEIEENIINLEAEDEVKEMKKLMLPIDMLLGDSSLAGKNMPCNVEKRRRKIDDEIFTEVVIVSCQNEDEANLPLPSPFRMQSKPPLSLISHIMKALASRHKSDINEQESMENMPNIVQRRPPPFIHQNPFHMKHNMESRPFSAVPSNMHIVPLKINVMSRPPAMSNTREFAPPFPFPMSPPTIKRISIRPLNLNEREMQHIDTESIIRSIPTFNSDITPEEGPSRPAHFPGNEPPIIIRRIQGNEENEMPRELSPLSLNPLMKLFPMLGKAKVIRIMPKPIGRHEALPHILSKEDTFHPPIEIIDHNEPNFDDHVPDASGRSLPSPRVALPGIRFLKLGNQPPLFGFPGPKFMTHMELRRPPHLEDNQNALPSPLLPVEEEGEEFGPPKIHTVIPSAPEPIFRSEHPDIPHARPVPQEDFMSEHHLHPQSEPISLSQLQPRFFVPPPPRFDREGRFSPMAEINPDAEVYTGPNTDHHTNHHLIIN